MHTINLSSMIFVSELVIRQQHRDDNLKNSPFYVLFHTLDQLSKLPCSCQLCWDLFTSNQDSRHSQKHLHWHVPLFPLTLIYTHLFSFQLHFTAFSPFLRQGSDSASLSTLWTLWESAVVKRCHNRHSSVWGFFIGIDLFHKIIE